MTDVHIEPTPEWARRLKPHLRPQHAPIFEGRPTPEDAQLALDLIEALDSESQAAYAASLPRLRALAA